MVQQRRRKDDIGTARILKYWPALVAAFLLTGGAFTLQAQTGNNRSNIEQNFKTIEMNRNAIEELRRLGARINERTRQTNDQVREMNRDVKEILRRLGFANNRQ